MWSSLKSFWMTLVQFDGAWISPRRLCTRRCSQISCVRGISHVTFAECVCFTVNAGLHLSTASASSSAEPWKCLGQKPARIFSSHFPEDFVIWRLQGMQHGRNSGSGLFPPTTWLRLRVRGSSWVLEVLRPKKSPTLCACSRACLLPMMDRPQITYKVISRLQCAGHKAECIRNFCCQDKGTNR